VQKGKTFSYPQLRLDKVLMAVPVLPKEFCTSALRAIISIKLPLQPLESAIECKRSNRIRARSDWFLKKIKFCKSNIFDFFNEPRSPALFAGRGSGGVRAARPALPSSDGVHVGGRRRWLLHLVC
jgi:hypothetical protein